MSMAWRYICSLLLIMLMVGCGHHDEPDSPEQIDPNSRTVLVYIVADNTLGSTGKTLVENDINEMIEGYKSSLVDPSIHNLLIYVDDHKIAKPTLFKLERDKKTGTVTKSEVYVYTLEQYSAEPVVIEDVVKRSFEAYPANSYGFVYWSHGEGWVPYPLLSRSIIPMGGRDHEMRWIGLDGTRTNITELADVFKGLNRHLSFILFDACFMYSIETAYDLKDVTDYVIGSPAETPGPGAYYDELVPQMFARNNVGEALAKAFYTPYAEIYDESTTATNKYWTGGIAVGAVKTSALDNLAAATKTALSTVGQYDFEELRASVLDYDTRETSYYSEYVGYFDMYDMMEYLLSKDAMNTWMNAYSAVQPYYMATPKIYSMFVENNGGLFSVEGGKGVSHYIPHKLMSSTPEDEQQALDQNYQLSNWYIDTGLSALGW